MSFTIANDDPDDPSDLEDWVRKMEAKENNYDDEEQDE